jgi:hypothetical protein
MMGKIHCIVVTLVSEVRNRLFRAGVAAVVVVVVVAGTCSTAKEDSTVSPPSGLVGSAVPWESVFPWDALAASREARYRAWTASSGTTSDTVDSSNCEASPSSSRSCWDDCLDSRVGV